MSLRTSTETISATLAFQEYPHTPGLLGCCGALQFTLGQSPFLSKPVARAATASKTAGQCRGRGHSQVEAIDAALTI
jgi:hypothetical protein